ncbi:hypothetical protein PPL_02273 [Heterostelium album PN500]|uniref:Uncharacterized protein n=1 Tax=Heterostelium pallidum (strain ATCC 26659 / Pp 5 / PN500) TaxID=670386 RepID=D3B1U9_HETP5|nr:hypothetical protein PPL_02273 [Heterostelium album PN500]EFA85273.1 hypothetical protein PPL_02273 [Heterostelium album PN500]|eukprot:XP_020437382.1 hypothetical protein PPL_02273 [Heterostelium album PN500]
MQYSKALVLLTILFVAVAVVQSAEQAKKGPLQVKVVQGAAIRNKGNFTDRKAVTNEVALINFSMIFRSKLTDMTNSAGRRTPIRIDNQGTTSTGYANLQAQINGISGASTVSAVLVSPSCQPDRDKSEKDQIESERQNVVRKVKDAMNQSYDTGKIFNVEFIILFLQVNKNNAQSLISSSTPFIQPFIYRQGCKVLVTVVFDYSQELNFNDIGLDAPDNFTEYGYPPVTLISQDDLASQRFLLNYYMNIGNFTMTLAVKAGLFRLPSSFICKKIEVENFKIISYTPPAPATYKPTSTFFIRFNFSQESSSKQIQSTVDATGVTCQCGQILRSVPQDWYCSLNLLSAYALLPAKLNITLSLYYYGYLTYIVVDNPFPYNAIRSSRVVDIIVYPPNLYVYTEDFRLQSDRSRTVEQYVTVQNMNSVIQNYKNTIEPFTLVSRNATISEYAYSTSYNIPAVRYQTIIQDTYSTKLYEYNATFIRLSIPEIPVNQQTETGTCQFAIFSTQLPFVFNYKLDYNFYSKMQPSILLMNPYAFDTVSDPIYKFAFVTSNAYENKLTIKFKPLSSQYELGLSGDLESINSTFVLNYVVMEEASPTTNIATISITTNVPLLNIELSLSIITEAHRISGDVYNGVYQIEFVTLPYGAMSLTPINIKGDVAAFYEGESFSSDLNLLVPSPIVNSSRYLIVTDLTYFKFNQTFFDLTNHNGVLLNNTLYFNTSKYVPNMIPYISFDTKNEYQYFGSYDYDLKLFTIKFPINSWMVDGDAYTIGDAAGYLIGQIDSMSVASIFNNSSDSKMIITNPSM